MPAPSDVPESSGKRRVDLDVLAGEIGKKISSRRKILGWTQADLAERIDVDPESISRFERGVLLPSLPTLATIAQELGTSIGALTSMPANPPDLATLRPVVDVLADLGAYDQAFVLERMQSLCAHLARKGTASAAGGPD